MRDIASNIGVKNALSPAVVSATAKGNAIDRKGFESVAFVINSGAIAGDGLYAPSVQDSDTTTDGDFAAVDAKFLIGTLPAALEADSAVRGNLYRTTATGLMAGTSPCKSTRGRSRRPMPK